MRCFLKSMVLELFGVNSKFLLVPPRVKFSRIFVKTNIRYVISPLTDKSNKSGMVILVYFMLLHYFPSRQKLTSRNILQNVMVRVTSLFTITSVDTVCRKSSLLKNYSK